MADNGLTPAEQKELAELEELDQLEKHFNAPENAITSNEMHPEIGTFSRWGRTNFATNPVETLRKQGFQVIEKDGGTFIKRPNETEYKAFDPNLSWKEMLTTTEGLKELGRDVGDVAYDVGTGFIKIPASIGGGLLTGGVGGAAAYGAVGLGAESLRQKIGKELGYQDEYNPFQLGAAALAPSGGVLASGALSGAVKLATKVGTSAAAMSSGIPKEVIEHYAKNPSLLQGEKGKTVSTKISQGLSEIQDTLTQAVKDKPRAVWTEQLEPLLKQNATKEVNLAVATEPVTKRIAELEAEYLKNPTPAVADDINALKDLLTHYIYPDKPPSGLAAIEGRTTKILGANGEEIPQALPKNLALEESFALKKRLSEAAHPAYETLGVSKQKSASNKEYISKAAEMQARLNDEIARVVGGEYKPAMANYADAIELSKEVAPRIKTLEGVNTLVSPTINPQSTVGHIKAERLAQLVPDSAKEDFARKMLDVKAMTAFANPSDMPLSSMGVTSTSRSVPLANMLSKVGGAVGALTGYHLGKGYSGAAVGGLAGAYGGEKLGNYMGSPAFVKQVIDLAREAGVSVETAQKWLSNTNDPSTLLKILGLSNYQEFQARKVSPWIRDQLKDKKL
jgi:hypothetical protein